MTKVARRIILALVLAALLPLAAAMVLALMLTEVSLGVGLNDTIRQGLQNDMPLYGELFEAKKALYQAQAEALAHDAELAEVWASDDAARLQARIQAALDTASAAGRDLVAIEVAQGARQVRVARSPLPAGRPHDVALLLGDTADVALTVRFVLPAATLRGLDEARELYDSYQVVARARDSIGRSLLVTFGATMAVFLALAVWVGTMLSRSVTRRVGRLAAATAAVAKGDLTVRIKERGSDEVADLSRAFNSMVAELADGRDRIVYLEKISGWQEVARRLAHEIKNPLTPIRLAVQQLDDKKPTSDPEFARLVTTAREIVDEEVAALQHLTQEFSAFARLPEVKPEPVDVRRYLEEIGPQLLATAPALLLELGADVGEVPVDRMLLRMALSNLVQNGVEAQAVPRDRARVRLRLFRQGAECVLQIDDAGPGIAPAVQHRLFEPYMTTKKHGTGLGLAIVKKVVLQHGGRIGATASPDLGGARFEVRLPLAAKGASP